MDKKDFKILIPLFLLSLLTFFSVLNIYFSGDDFFHFKVSQTDGSLLGFIKLFGVYPFEERGIAFYRPLFREALFNIFYSLFGLNHLPFRVLQFILHFVNITLVYVTFKKVFAKKVPAILASLFFAFSAAHIGSLYYLAGGVHSQAVLMFTLLTLLSFWQGKKVASLVFFILALMTDELALAIPILLAGSIWLKHNQQKIIDIEVVKKILTAIWPYIVLNLVLLFVVVFIIGTSQSEAEYKINLNPKTLVNTLTWYSVWGLGIPEMLVDFLGSGLRLNPDLLKNWGNYFKIIFTAFAGLLAVIFFSLVRSWKKLGVFKDKEVMFLFVWFVVGILPVLFWPIHKKTVYLQVSLPAICGLLAYVFSKSSRFTQILGVIVFLILNITTIKLAETTYWAGQRGKVAQKLISDFQSQYPTLPTGAIVKVKNDPNYPFISKQWGGTSTQAYFVWNGNDALQLMYGDPTIKVIYGDKTTGDILFDSTHDFIAEIN